jgi:hypothetical protein
MESDEKMQDKNGTCRSCSGNADATATSVRGGIKIWTVADTSSIHRAASPSTLQSGPQKNGVEKGGRKENEKTI